jgi:starvation-inducible DNA-binding protein
MNPQSMRAEEFEVEMINRAIRTASNAASRSSVAVLEELLTHSIPLRDLYKNARLQIPSGQFPELRRILDDHYKEQLSLVDAIIDRIRVLGGAVGVFASEFLQSGQSCRLLRGPRAFRGLLHDFLDAHESVLSAARPHYSNDDHHWVRDFAVGQVVLTNEQQCELISGLLLRNEPQQGSRQTDV